MKDRYEIISSASRYKVLRCGIRTLTVYLGAFVLRSNGNGNTIIYCANYNECIKERKFWRPMWLAWNCQLMRKYTCFESSALGAIETTSVNYLATINISQ